MSFVRVVNYDGTKGYIGDDLTRLDIFEMDGVKFLMGTETFRIVREGEDTAVAVRVTNEATLEELDRCYEASLDDGADEQVRKLVLRDYKIVSDTMTTLLEHNQKEFQSD